MGGVTGGAFPFNGGLVLLCVVADLILFHLMTVMTQCCLRFSETQPVVSGMRIVASGAARFEKGLMHMFSRHSADHVFMTGQAKIGSDIYES